MRKNALLLVTVLILVAVPLLVIGSRTLMSQGASARAPQNNNQEKRKTLREIGHERDVETEVSDLESNAEYHELRWLAKDSTAILIGRIIHEASSFSGDDNISTSYQVDVHRVLKDNTNEVIPILQLLGDPEVPAPLSTPLKVMRSGGVVYLNNHKVSKKLKGSDALEVDADYILFLHWSRDYKAYYLVGGASGAILVGKDSRVIPLGSEKGMTKYKGVTLESIIEELLKTQ